MQASGCSAPSVSLSITYSPSADAPLSSYKDKLSTALTTWAQQSQPDSDSANTSAPASLQFCAPALADISTLYKVSVVYAYPLSALGVSTYCPSADIDALGSISTTIATTTFNGMPARCMPNQQAASGAGSRPSASGDANGKGTGVQSSSSSNANGDKKSGGSNIVGVIAGAVGGIGGTLAIVFGVLYMRRRKQQKLEEAAGDEEATAGAEIERDKTRALDREVRPSLTCCDCLLVIPFF